MPDETSRRYLFVAINHATRWVFLHIYHGMTDTSSIDFLRRLKDACPIKLSKILTDNDSQFTDRFTNKDKKPSGRHVFDKVCAAWASNIVWHRPAIRKRMVWSSDLTVVSASCCSKSTSIAV